MQFRAFDPASSASGDLLQTVGQRAEVFHTSECGCPEFLHRSVCIRWQSTATSGRTSAQSAALADFLNRVRLHWAWYARNLDAVERILTEKLMQTPDRAKYSAAASPSVFQPLDGDLVRREQHILDVLFGTKDMFLCRQTPAVVNLGMPP
jgi:hypothetical protein